MELESYHNKEKKKRDKMKQIDFPKFKVFFGKGKNVQKQKRNVDVTKRIFYIKNMGQVNNS